jgi:DNA-binding CsgD family transcriptional regulator
VPGAGPQPGPSTTRLLSERERQYAVLASFGHPNRRIAEELFLSPRTVEAHMSRILMKLGIGSRSALVGRLGHLDLRVARDSR